MVNLLASIPAGSGNRAPDGVCTPVAGAYAALLLRPAALSVCHDGGPGGISAHRTGFARDPPTRGVGAVRHWANDPHAMD